MLAAAPHPQPRSLHGSGLPAARFICVSHLWRQPDPPPPPPAGPRRVPSSSRRQLTDPTRQGRGRGRQSAARPRVPRSLLGCKAGRRRLPRARHRRVQLGRSARPLPPPEHVGAGAPAASCSPPGSPFPTPDASAGEETLPGLSTPNWAPASGWKSAGTGPASQPAAPPPPLLRPPPRCSPPLLAHYSSQRGGGTRCATQTPELGPAPGTVRLAGQFGGEKQQGTPGERRQFKC